MAFVSHVVNIPNAKIGRGTGVRAALRKRGDRPAQLALVLDQKVAERYDWRSTDRLEVQIGDGEHQGLIRLRKNNSVGTAIVDAKKSPRGDSVYVEIRLGVVSQLPNEARSPSWCGEIRDVGETWVEIALPSWARGPLPVRSVDGTLENGQKITGLAQGVVSGARVANAAVSAAANFRRPRRDVLPGDPPSGRSALDQKLSGGGS